MSDPVLALVLLIAFIAALGLVRFFKTVDFDFWSAARVPLIAGLVAGVIIRLLDAGSAFRIGSIGILLTVVALYVRLTGHESEPVDGMILGALSGAAAAFPLVISGDEELRTFAQCVLAGGVAGFGITIAVFHVGDKLRQIALDLATAAAAVGAAYLPNLAAHLGATEDQIGIGASLLIPIVVIATVFQQYRDIRAELRHEASLGFIADRDVRPTAHPLLRLGRGGWRDAHAHREFVRIANLIALRKRQQRNRPDERARLYQLEIIKLRMQLQEMSRIDAGTHVHSLGRRPSRPQSAGVSPGDE